MNSISLLRIGPIPMINKEFSLHTREWEQTARLGLEHVITHDNDNSIDIVLPPESFTPQINTFSNWDVNQVPVYQYSLNKNIIQLFPDYDQELSPNDISIMGLNL